MKTATTHIISKHDKIVRNILLICFLLTCYLEFTDILYVGLLSSYTIIALGIYCMVYRIPRRPPFINSFLGVLFLLLFYFLVGDKSIFVPYEGFAVGVYKNIVFPLLLMLSLFTIMYYLGERAALRVKDLIIFLFLLIPFAVYKYEYSFIQLSLQQVKDVSLGDLTNSTGYIFVALLPFLFLFKNRIIPIILYVGVLYGVVSSGKRGAILIAAVFAFYYIYEYYLHKKFSLFNIILTVIFIAASFFIVTNWLANSDYLNERFILTTEGYSSGRNRIAHSILSHFYDTDVSIFTILFGGGMGYSVELSGNWAHNDWLEFFSMAGLLGFTVYLTFYVKILQIARNYSYRTVYKYIFVASGLILFLKSLFSMSLFFSGTNNYPLMIIMGYSYGVIISNKKEVI